MLTNPKTTIPGYLILAAAVLNAAAAFMDGRTPDFTTILSALSGVGLVMAKDGGH